MLDAMFRLLFDLQQNTYLLLGLVAIILVLLLLYVLNIIENQVLMTCLVVLVVGVVAGNNSNFQLQDPCLTGLRNIEAFEDIVPDHIYGQPIALGMVVDALKAHRAARSRKPLIMSLHGDIGTGKTALSMLLARAMFGYKEGEEYGASGVYIIDKPFGATDEEYRDFIRKTLGGALRSGRGSLFVFERMDDVPGNITNLLKKQLEARGQKHCKNEAIFLLNTHIGSEELDRLAITSWLDGVDRDHITRVKLQAAITAASGDTSDPLAHRWHRRMVEHGLITESVPFLPLDRSIVRRCLIRQMTYIAFYDEERRSADLHKAMSDLAFYPYQHQVFAKNGCANISQTLK